MKINSLPVNNLTQNVYSVSKYNQPKTLNNISQSQVVKVPVDSLKANFLPSFGQKKDEKVVIYDRKTGEEVLATVKKQSVCDEYYMFKLCVGRKVVGKMNMMMNADCPLYNDDWPPYANPVEKKTFPQILDIRTYEGDKYSNIGTALVDLAIEQSVKAKHKGALWLESCKGYDSESSAYRSGENPIPFYYKLGFRAADEDDKKIRAALKKGDYENLPSDIILHLSVDDAQRRIRAKY